MERQGIWAWFFLMVLCGWMFLAGLGDRDLTSSHEGRAAQNAQMILSDGGWGLPRLFNNRLELQKPPLYYWLVAWVGWIRGGSIDAWAVRLPAALSACLCVLLLVLWGRRLGRPWAGWCAGLVLATCLHFTWLARVARIDMPLTLAVTTALIAFQWAHLGAPFRWRLLAYTALALGVLLKGPIALVLAAAGSLAVSIGAPAPGRPLPWAARWGHLCWGIPFLLALTLPWFLWANHVTDNKIWDVFVWYHNIERGLGSDVLAAHPFWFYLARFWLDFFPWSLLVPVMVWSMYRRPSLGEDRGLRWGLASFAGMLLFLSCMRFKRADYLLPAYPCFAWMMGCWLERWFPASGPTNLRTLDRALVGLAVILAVGWGGYRWLSQDDEQGTSKSLAQSIRKQTHNPVIFFRIEAHALAFHIGRPQDTILEWENLEIWASQKEPIYFVMPPDCAASWAQHLQKARLEEVLRVPAPGQRERVLVVMRSVSRDGSPNS